MKGEIKPIDLSMIDQEPAASKERGRRPSPKNESAGSAKRGRGGVNGTAGPAELPQIEAVAGELPHVVDAAEEALLASAHPVFVRAGALVEPITETTPAARNRTTTVAKFRPLCLASIVDLLARSAAFVRYDGRSKKLVPIDPPSKVASILLAHEGTWKFPRVAGIITTPTLRPDGTVLDAHGYDPATRLYLALDPDLKLPCIPDRPTRDEAERALALLSSLLTGFPFVGPVDHAVALSCLITPVIRGGISVAPMHVARAHAAGTGKSLLVDVAATIATGRPCPVITAGKNEEETEKRLGALLRDGVPIVSIDNLNVNLGGDALCQMTERPFVRMRILGLSEAPEFECKATLFATGNNVTLLGDMTRRAIVCNLDAAMERPELRSFDFDPIARVLADRGAYVAAALTIARAFRVPATRHVCAPIGSYGEWSEAVRAPLVWLGEADPVESMNAARDEDPELMAIRELFAHWQKRMSLHEGYTSNKVIGVACEQPFGGSGFLYPEFRDLLLRMAGDGGAVSSRRLGKWLARINGRVVNGHRLVMKVDPSNGNRFALVPNEPGR